MANVESQINVRLLVVEDQKLLLQSLQRGLIAEVFCVGAGWPCLVRKLSEECHLLRSPRRSSVVRGVAFALSTTSRLHCFSEDSAAMAHLSNTEPVKPSHPAKNSSMA